MFSYVKWELKSVLSDKKVSFITILVVFVLQFLFIKLDVLDSILGSILSMVFTVILIMCSINSFFAGAKRTMDTYNKPTFLLESMIPISSGKLVLAKYIIAVALNLFYVLMFLLGVYMVIFLTIKDEWLIEVIVEAFGTLIEENLGSFLRALVYMFLLSMAYTSFVTTVFCFLKSHFPNGKKLKGLAIVLGYIGFLIISSLYGDLFSGYENLDLIMDVFLIVIILLGYFITIHFVENKMEIYC